MPASQQLRQARGLLAWSLAELSARTALPVAVLAHAEQGEGAPDITIVHLARLQAAFEASGVVFGPDGTVALSTKRHSL